MQFSFKGHYLHQEIGQAKKATRFYSHFTVVKEDVVETVYRTLGWIIRTQGSFTVHLKALQQRIRCNDHFISSHKT